jgi:hypothetical protein
VSAGVQPSETSRSRRARNLRSGSFVARAAARSYAARASRWRPDRRSRSARGVKEVLRLELAAGADGLESGEPSGRAVAHGDGDRVVQVDDRRRGRGA